MRCRTVLFVQTLLFCSALCFAANTADTSASAGQINVPAQQNAPSAGQGNAPAQQNAASAGQGNASPQPQKEAPSAGQINAPAQQTDAPQEELVDSDDLILNEAAPEQTGSDEIHSGEPEEPLGTVIPDAARKTLEIDGADNSLTAAYRTRYLTNTGKQRLAKALADSAPYRPYIRQQLEAAHLPLILQYLPIVESNYKPSAVSRAGAVGIWQFMTNSMAPYLKKNAWYDERRDPWKSTDAAIAKLGANYAMFGDWAIAIAAYNCGAGAMTRITKKNPGKDFWYLAEHGLLRNQSAQYVPQLLAIADIVENAEYYGAVEIGAADKIIEDLPVQEFDYVTVAGMLSLNQIAQVTGIDRETVFLLNPALFRNCTPARMTYDVRFPKGSGEQAESTLKDHGVATDAVTYTIKQGDSLWALSRKYGITVQDLCDVNNIKESSILYIGQTLIVPIFKEGK